MIFRFTFQSHETRLLSCESCPTVQTLEERDKQLKHELEMTRQRAGMDERAAHAVAEVESAVGWGWLQQWVVAMIVGLVVP